MINRNLKKELLKLSKEYPVVTITGPRQSGKTTLAKDTFKKYNYSNLEDPQIRDLASSDPKLFFKEFKTPLIIDEIQRVPQLLSYIQVLVDETDKKAIFVLTGSNQLKLHESISQSLAGRTALTNLLPLSISELNNHNIVLDSQEYLLKGFLPRIYKDNIDPSKLYRNYFQTYVEKDLRQLINVKDLTMFQNFMRLLAGRTAQLLNLNNLSSQLGVSSTTLSNWLSVLEASFIVFKVYPYYENFGKRIIKTPKVYFVEPGLLTYLLGIKNIKEIRRDPLFGNLFENLVVVEFIKSRFNKGEDHDLYFFQDNNKIEVDLLYKKGRTLIPIEVKSAMTFNNEFFKGLNSFYKLVPETNKGYLVYSGDLTPRKNKTQLINFKNINKIF